MDTSSLVGTWVNFDPATQGIARAVVRPKGEHLVLSIGEAGHPELRAWPDVVAIPLAASVGDRGAMGFVGHVDGIGPSDFRRAALYGYVNRGLLTITAHVAFPLGSGKVNWLARAHYYRSESPD
jgi:hypothetical protein